MSKTGVSSSSESAGGMRPGQVERRAPTTHYAGDDGARRDLIVELANEKRRLADLIGSVRGVVWEAHGPPESPSQRMEFVSDYVEQMLGYSVDECLATANFWLRIVHPEDRERAAREAADAFAAGRGRVSEFRWIARDGRVLWVEARTSIVVDEQGRPIGTRGVTIDISRRKRIQQALRRRAQQVLRIARQLKEKNAELDQFAYVTSHDLRAPLRGIANLSQWIEEDMAERFTPEAHQQMDLLRGRVQRMEALIDGILEFSRVGRERTAKELVDVGELLRGVIDLLAPPPEARVEIIEPMPKVLTERLRLQQVFMNLIGNALKHNPRADKWVEVSSRDLGTEYEFTVADNGPGIERQYHEKIFVIFQTLVARDKVEGAGVGLSLVKKIVENHGGTIRVESSPGAGARFIFTWSKAGIAARSELSGRAS
jgi:PAS domain S-box-containing protein